MICPTAASLHCIAESLAVGRTAYQSSTVTDTPMCTTALRGCVASSGVDGNYTGTWVTTSATEDRPWWSVYLGTTYLVRRVVVYPRKGNWAGAGWANPAWGDYLTDLRVRTYGRVARGSFLRNRVYATPLCVWPLCFACRCAWARPM